MNPIWIRKFWKAVFRRSYHPSDNNVIRLLKGGGGVSEQTALRFAAVFSCVRVLSESVAQLPLKIYRRKDGGGRLEAEKHPLYSLLHDAPNPYTTAFNFWEQIMASLALWGNAYALPDIDGSGRIAALWFLDPANVTPRQLENGAVVYDVWSKRTGSKTYLWNEIFHVPGLGFDGVQGKSIVRVASEAIGQGIAASEYAGKFFENDATPRGVLETDTVFKDETALDRLRKNWNDLYQGTGNAHRVAILENGLKFKPLTINPEDAQLLETRKFNRSEIAGIFRVPLHMIADLEHATFSNIEHQSIEFVKFSLSPWMRRIEQAITLQLLTPSERKRYFAEWNADGMLRGDVQSRYTAYQTATQGGWMSINEVRGKENLPPIEGGDKHYLQMQMIPISQAGKEEEDGQGNPSDPGGVPGEGSGE